MKTIITTSPPPFVERVIQTFKNMLMTRVEASKMKTEQWTEFLQAVIQSIIVPHIVVLHLVLTRHKAENRFAVLFNIRKKAQWNRLYPNLEIG